MQRSRARHLLAQYASAGVTTDRAVLEHARMMGPAALAEAQAALESVHEGLQLEFLSDLSDDRQEALQMLADVASQNDQLLLKRGIDLEGCEYLGAGNNGAAWKLADGRVLKVTTDDAEAHVASHLRGKHFKHISTIYDCWAFPQQINGHHIYGLITEAGLIKPTQQEVDEFDDMADTLTKYEEIAGVVSEENLKLVLETMMRDPEFPRESKAATLKSIKKFDFQGMMADMRKAGFVSDMHGGNFMKRPDGTFVIIDIGTGGSNQDSAKPPFVEGTLDLDGLLHEVGVLGAPQAGPRSQMRSSNSSAWASGRMVLANPQEHMPVDDSEEDWSMDQNHDSIKLGSNSPY